MPISRLSRANWFTAGAATLLIAPAIAFADVSPGDVIGTADQDIRANLEAAGYTVLEVEREDGELEAEVLIDGQEFEIGIAPETGEVIEIEPDD